MYTEELTQKTIGTAAGILVTLGLAVCVLFCGFAVMFLQWVTGYAWIQIILYVLLILVAYAIVKKRLTNYIYLIEKDRITFGRRVGKREKELLFVPLRDIVSFGPYAHQQTSAGKKRYRFTFRGKRDWYVIDCTGCTIVLTPTRSYIESLEQATGKRGKDDGKNTDS